MSKGHNVGAALGATASFFAPAAVIVFSSCRKLEGKNSSDDSFRRALRSSGASGRMGPVAASTGCCIARACRPAVRQLGIEFEDRIDFARRRQCNRNSDDVISSFLNSTDTTILQQPGIRFVEVPQLQRAAPATSFREAGISRFHVDLLPPSPDESFPIRAVPELKAHAVGLPYLAYLLGTSQTGTLLSRHGAVPVRVPDANRFAIHKLLVSQLRDHASTKVLKDVQQAAVLLACLGEHHPGSIEDACAALPKSARRRTTRALKVLEPLLNPHPAAWNEITEALSA